MARDDTENPEILLRSFRLHIPEYHYQGRSPRPHLAVPLPPHWQFSVPHLPAHFLPAPISKTSLYLPMPRRFASTALLISFLAVDAKKTTYIWRSFLIFPPGITGKSVHLPLSATEPKTYR
jgi:hypothetical protein